MFTEWVPYRGHISSMNEWISSFLYYRKQLLAFLKGNVVVGF